jgi:hypothetical protein
MVASIAVVLLDRDGMRPANDVALQREYFGEGAPIVRVKGAVGQAFDFVAESLEGCNITTAENPGDSSP